MPNEWWKKPRWNDSDWEHSGDQPPGKSEFRDDLDSSGYVSSSDLNALGPKLPFSMVNLDNLTIPNDVIEMITESMARENMVIAVRFEDHAVVVAMADPNNLELFEKLCFVLNRPITPAAAPLDSIAAAIDRHYR